MIDDNDEILGGVIVEINDDNINHLDFYLLDLVFKVKELVKQYGKK